MSIIEFDKYLCTACILQIVLVQQNTLSHLSIELRMYVFIVDLTVPLIEPTKLRISHLRTHDHYAPYFTNFLHN